MDELREKLKTDIDQADWSMLRPHYEKGSVLFVDEKLELADVGVAIAQDKVEIVKLWLNDGLVSKPDEKKVKVFEEQEFLKQFKFLIIQPYVLVKHYSKEELS